MEALNEQQYPLVKLVQKLALESELVRVQVLQVQALRVQVQLEPLVQLELLAQEQAQLELLTQEQVQLELERHLQRNHPKPQLHRHRCKVPDRSREPQ